MNFLPRELWKSLLRFVMSSVVSDEAGEKNFGDTLGEKKIQVVVEHCGNDEEESLKTESERDSDAQQLVSSNPRDKVVDQNNSVGSHGDHAKGEGEKRKEREDDASELGQHKRFAGERDQVSSSISNYYKSEEQNSVVESSTEHANLVASHYNAIEEVGLAARDQSLIIYMRNFNNWIKSMLINEYMDKIKEKKNYGEAVRVLDMCCGKGGDLAKWERARIAHLICVDIAATSVEQCQSRYESRRRNANFTAEFLTYDCTKVRLREKYKDPSMHLDLVSCQFAFHYSFESLPQAECMLKNASESLKAGGYFIGTIPNAYELVSRWQKSEADKFGNDIYSIEFQCERDNVPLFGAKYHFHLEGVVDCPEFLVYFPLFCKLAWKFGLQLVMFERFDDFFERKKHEGKNLLSRMKALQTFSSSKPLSAKESEEYAHAVEYLNSAKDRRDIGTLSKSEWEATTIYSVFAFQKAKTTWNAEGKPEYVK